MFQINNQRAPLTDVHVRRAISYAFDYDGFNKDILGGSVERNPVPIPNNMWSSG
jgi:peptide/nickel transport system substrate-binding protein